jgi:membrane-associated phospholipid phosphatase
MRKRAATVLSWLGPDLSALSLFTCVWLGLVVEHGGRLHLVDGSILFPCYLAIGFLVFAAVSHCSAVRRGVAIEPYLNRAGRILRDWFPLILLTMVYETLRDYTGLIRPDYVDARLYRLDVAIFGVEPVIWIQRFINPFWTDYMSAMYGLYIMLPLTLAAFLYGAQEIEPFREVALGVVTCMYVGFVLYITFPAGPPRFFPGLQQQFSPKALTGMFGLYEATQHAMDRSKYVVHRASFPSLHVALSSLAVLQAWKFGGTIGKGWIFGIWLFIAAGIWISTIYLRHHWAVDVLAGFALAGVSFVAGAQVMRMWSAIDRHSAHQHVALAAEP